MGEQIKDLKPREEKREAEFQPQTEKPKFKSSFKAWIRIVAFVVAAIFIPEQVAQAVEYDWRVLWQKPASGAFAPTYLKNISEIDIPSAIKKVLLDIANKPITAIKISPTLTVELEKPLNISQQRIEEIYNWLKGKPCGSKALYDFLTYQGVQVIEQDIAVLALTIDILNDVVRPEGNPEVIKNSLYALSRTAEFFGHKLYPVKLDFNTITQEPYNTITPFIAHLKGDHYVLVTRISEDKVYFADEHQEEFLPREKFLEVFSGYALITGYNPQSPTCNLLTDGEAKKILGAKTSYAGKYTDLSPLFAEPKTGDLLLGLGLTVLSAYMFGGAKNMNSLLGKFGESAFYSTMSQTATNLAVQSFHWDPGTAQIFGIAVTGALQGGIAQPKNLWQGVGQGFLKGAFIGAGQVLAYDQLKNTGFYKKNPQIASQFANLLGAAVGHLAFSGIISGSSGLKNAWNDLKTDLTYKAAALAVEYALGPKNMKYSRILGDAIRIAGNSRLEGKSINFGEILMEGAVSGLLSSALSRLGGDYNELTGLNKWGMTPIQQAAVNWLGTALISSAFKGANFSDRLANLQYSLLTFGGTNEAKSGWDRTSYLMKLGEFSKVSSFKANADFLMKVYKYDSWKKFVADGRVASLIPSFGYSLVDYTASTLQYAAVDNFSGIATGMFIAAPRRTNANKLGIKPGQLQRRLQELQDDLKAQKVITSDLVWEGRKAYEVGDKDRLRPILELQRTEDGAVKIVSLIAPDRTYPLSPRDDTLPIGEIKPGDIPFVDIFPEYKDKSIWLVNTRYFRGLLGNLLGGSKYKDKELTRQAVFVGPTKLMAYVEAKIGPYSKDLGRGSLVWANKERISAIIPGTVEAKLDQEGKPIPTKPKKGLK